MTDRTNELRHALVTIGDAAPYQPRLPRRRLAVVAIAAFAIAGAATGGAVASNSLNSDDPTDERVQLSGDLARRLIVGTHADLFGEPFNFLGQGTTTVELGEIPNGATTLALSLDCVDPGTYDMSIDGEWTMSDECTADSIAQVGGGGGQLTVIGGGAHTLSITGPGRYIVWAQWSAEHAVPPTSAAQTEAMADGVVTREEYVAGFDRFTACMTGAGYTVDGGNREATVISYATASAAADDGTDRRCYEPEFMLLDIEWQLANADTSATTDLMRTCLTARGIIPLPTRAEIDQQFTDNGIDFFSCLP